MVGETEQTDNSLSKKEVTYIDVLFSELLQKISITFANVPLLRLYKYYYILPASASCSQVCAAL